MDKETIQKEDGRQLIYYTFSGADKIDKKDYTGKEVAKNKEASS